MYLILGIGGSMGLAVPAKQLSFAFVMNRMDVDIPFEVDPRYKSILDAIATKLESGC